MTDAKENLQVEEQDRKNVPVLDQKNNFCGKKLIGLQGTTVAFVCFKCSLSVINKCCRCDKVTGSSQLSPALMCSTCSISNSITSTCVRCNEKVFLNTNVKPARVCIKCQPFNNNQCWARK